VEARRFYGDLADLKGLHRNVESTDLEHPEMHCSRIPHARLRLPESSQIPDKGVNPFEKLRFPHQLVA
jgi:hypothetical protein